MNTVGRLAPLIVVIAGLLSGCSSGEPLATVPCCDWFPVNGGEPPAQDSKAPFPVPAPLPPPPAEQPIPLRPASDGIELHAQQVPAS